MSPRLLPLLASSALVPVSAVAQQQPVTPTGGTVVVGQATIGSPDGGRLIITQATQKAAINWESFSVGPGAHVDIVQPNIHSVLLNRVSGTAPSTIAGSLTANGRVYLINPNGILITKTGTVSVAGLVASTLDINPEALFATDRQIIAGAAGSSIVNDGQIRIAQGGYAALIGGRVRNTGLIAAPMGHVSLAAGTTATIDFSGDGFLQVAVPEEGIESAGALNDGMVAFRPGAAMAAARRVVNLSAARQAVSVAGSDGNVYLSGTVDVASASGNGGSITVTGRDITLSQSSLDASGALGGGRIRIGGDWQGQGDLPRADTLTVDAASTIRADAPQSGDGGTIVLWSDNVTDFRGTISARSLAGTGGDTEVSGKALLNYEGSADLRGLTFGTLLLDPYNITISSAANSNVSGFTPTGNNSVINATSLVYALATANVSISTGTAGSQAGTISLNTNISWQSSSTLTLTASDRISLSGDINAPNGNLNLSGRSISPDGAIIVNRFTLQNGIFNQSRPTGLPVFIARDFRVTGDVSSTSFIRNLGGDGNGDPFIVADIYGLQGLRELNPRVASNANVSQNIDASITATWNGGQGFQPLGSNGTPWQWNLNGNSRQISNLTINRPTVDNQGLIGLLGAGNRTDGVAGSVRRVILSNASIIGRDNVGALVGSGSGAISNSYVADSSVRGRNQVGGVVGLLTSTGSLNLSFAFADVTGSTAVGGLIGHVNGGSVDQTWSSGAVRGTGNSTQIGGLVGRQTGGAITASYWDIETSGQISSFGGAGLTTAQARRQSSYVGFDFNSSWFQGDGTGDSINPTGLRPVPQTFGPLVFTSGAVLVSNVLQLQLAVRNLTNNIILFNDIDASATAGTNPAGIWSSAGFFPLGNAANPLTGSIDGAGSVIRNLTINRPTSNDVGLVGVLSGTVRNVALVDSNITGQNSVGGLVGRALPSANITQSYSAAQITGVDGVGGLVGFNEGQIQNSYASGPVTGALAVGGLVGTNNGSISQAYATGRVTGLQSPGGLVGAINASSSVINAYWDIQTTGLSTSQGGGVGLTTADAQDLGRFRTIWAGFDFNSVWAAPNQVGQNNNSPSAFYPEIFSTSRIVAVNPSGTGFYGNAISPITAQYIGLQPSLRIRLVANGPLIGLRSPDRIVSPGTFTAPVSVTSPVGSYAISGSGVQANDSRYRYVYLPSSYEVTPRPVTITADALSRIYGDANPALTYQVGGLGLVNGDTLGGMLATAATTTSNVGSYAITQGSLSASSNYALTYVGSQLAVTPRALTVVSRPQARIYGDANPTLTYQIGGAGLVNGDTLTGLLATTATTTSNVGSYAITQGSLTGGSNYALTYLGGQLLVRQRPLTITADPLSRIYGDANPALTYRVGATAAGTGLVNGDTLSGLLATVATTTSNVGSYAITQGSLSASSNYALTYAGANLSVTPRGLTITADPLSRIYGDANPALTYRVGATGARTGLVNGDALSGLLATSANTTSNVGSYEITQGTLTAGGNYALSYTGAQLVVTPRALTITADPLSRIYGDANPALTYRVGATAAGTGLVNGDTLSGLLATVATTASNIGSYDITQGSLSGGSNYAISYSGAQLAVTPRALTITADPLSRIYGDANPALTYRVGGLGLVNGDTLTGLLATTATTTSNVGSYAITQGSLTGGSNYALSYSGAELAVTPRGLTITADPLSRIYGDANPALTYRVGGLGLVNGDTLTGLLATTATTTSNVGSYAITQGTLSASSNYALSYTAAQLSVTPRALTVTADPLSRIYGDANPALTYQVGAAGLGTGLVNGDTLSGLLATSATTTNNVGSYDITQGTLTAGSNYALSYTGAQLAVTPRGLAITADPLSRIYGDANPALTYQVGGAGLVNGDGLTGSLANSATTISNVGSYAITQGSLSAGGNYSLTFVGAQLAVTPRGLTITAGPLSRIYGDANPLSGSASGVGLVNGDNVSAVTLSSAADSASAVGRYDLLASDALGTGLGNYTISYANNVGGLTVTPRSLIITADPLSRIYGEANPELTYKVGGGGLVSGDTLAGLLATSATTSSNVGSYTITQGSLTAGSNYALSYTGALLSVTPRALTVTADPLSRIYGDANPLSGSATGVGLVNGDKVSAVTLSSPAMVTSGVGHYDLLASNAVGTGLGNYTISYAVNAGGLIVAPRSLTITADPLSRIYGDANPALTHRVGGLGLVNGDELAGMLATTATTTSKLGSYDITQGTLSAGSNYALTYTGAQLAVTPRGLTITADPLSRIYGDANPLTGSASGAGLVNGDVISTVTLASTADTASAVGRYDLLASNAVGTGLANYTISYAANIGGLSVTPRGLTITADPLSRVYGDANPALTYRVSAAAAGTGLVNGDTLSGVLATGATTTSNIGSYAITQGSLTAGSNYALSYTAAQLSVTPRTLTITADPLSRIYGDANPALTYRVGGAGLVNGDTLGGMLVTSATSGSNVGSYDVTQGSLSAGSNYALTYVGAQLAVTPRGLIITADPLSRIFGDPNPPLTYQVGGAGLANGDTLTGMLATIATIASNVGSHDIMQGSLSAGSNYALTYVPATLTIHPGKLLPPVPFSSLFLKQWIEASIIAEPGKLEDIEADRYRPVVILQTPAFFPLRVCRKDIPCPDDHLAVRIHQANPPEAGLALRNKADEHSADH